VYFSSNFRFLIIIKDIKSLNKKVKQKTQPEGKPRKQRTCWWEKNIGKQNNWRVEKNRKAKTRRKNRKK
jgi:hypothetical protein